MIDIFTAVVRLKTLYPSIMNIFDVCLKTFECSRDVRLSLKQRDPSKTRVVRFMLLTVCSMTRLRSVGFIQFGPL